MSNLRVGEKRGVTTLRPLSLIGPTEVLVVLIIAVLPIVIWIVGLGDALRRPDADWLPSTRASSPAFSSLHCPSLQQWVPALDRLLGECEACC